MRAGPRTGRPIVVAADGDQGLGLLFPTSELELVGPSLTRFGRALRKARARSEGRARPVIAVTGSDRPHFVIAARRGGADRVVLLYREETRGAVEEASLRAAFAFVDLTVSDDARTSARAIAAGADPDRVALAAEPIEARVLSEPARGKDRAATIEALASLSLDAADKFGLLSMLERVTPDRGVNVVNYHRVLPVEEHRRYGRPQMALSAPTFEAQLEAMHTRFGFTSIHRAHAPDATGSVVVTFDDGYEDNYRVALPILEAFEVPASIFVATGLVGSPDAAFWDRVQLALFSYWRAGSKRPLPADLPASAAALETAESVSEARAIITRVLSDLNALGPDDRARAVAAAESLAEDAPIARTMLSWDEVKEMARRGIHFGSHTKNHVCLDEVSPEVAKRELIDGHEELRRQLPEDVDPPDTVALPRGKLGPFREEELRARGFKAVMTTEARVNRPSEAGLFVHRRDGKMLTLRGRHHEAKLRLELTGIPDRIRRLLGVKAD